MLKQPRKLTNEEAAFAAENHSKIYDFLYENGLSCDDFYDVAVLVIIVYRTQEFLLAVSLGSFAHIG